jgi:transcriptional regulator with GAF, ATPase, and Fis domain
MAKQRNTPVGPVQRHWPPAGLKVVGARAEVQLRPGFTVRIGRSPANDLCLADELVSAVHCVVDRPAPGKVVIKDLGSTNGTFVNGVRVAECELVAGATVRLGQSFLAVAAEAPRHRPASELLLGRSPRFRAALARAQSLAATELSILVRGETGTGKELVARLIHEWSPRAHGPFVALNCAAIPRELIESELFGHEKGAFTGAADRHLGLFERAAGGTLFLDEVGELGGAAQASLLRALETRRIRRVGSAAEHDVDVRFVAATHRDLESAAADGDFRADLYHRLRGADVVLPPLRDRPEDIPLLVSTFYDGALSAATMARIAAYSWPGNVRELKHAMGLARALGEAELALDPPDAPPDGLTRRAIELAVDAYGSYRNAARYLDVPKSTLHERARRFGVRSRRGR